MGPFRRRTAGRQRAGALAVVAAVATGLLAPAAGHAAGAQVCPPGEVTVQDDVVTSSDGTEIAITVMRPGAADCGPVPVIVHGHGWSQSRATGPDAALNYGTPRMFLDAGYGFVSFDHRGHGESGDVAHSMQPDFELRDYPAVLDHVHDQLDWVQREPDSGVAKDIVAGSYGASYGGGWQTMTSTVDDRIDALVPLITWYDLAQALAPNGVPRTAWLGLLTVAGNTLARMDPQLNEWYVETMATNRTPEASHEHFRAASPATRTERLRTPALLIQGLPDTLFPLNDAVGLYEAIRANGVDARLIGINSGHVLPRLQPTGVNAPDRDRIDGCTTDLYAHVVDYYDAELRGDAAARRRVAAVPRVAVATEQGRCVVADDWPVNDREVVVEVGDVVVPQGAGTLLLPLLTPEEDTTIAGIPRLTAQLPVELDDIVFSSLVIGDPAAGGWVVDDQVTPLRTALGATGGAVDLELAAVATTVPAGATLALRIEGVNEQFALNGNRRPGGTPLTDLSVTLPVASQGAVEAFDTTPAAAPPEPSPDAPADVAAPEHGSLPATGGGAALAGLAAALAAGALRRRR